jgi:hypothetical protein
MSGDHMDDRDGTLFEKRVAASALAAAPLVAVFGIVAMFLSPHAFAESDSATGSGLWLGAVLGLALFVAFDALPQLLFGLALRSGTRGKLTATAVVAPLWAVYFGLLPLVSAITGGWKGLAPLAVVTAAAAGILDVFVFLAAFRRVRRLRTQHPSPHIGETNDGPMTR